MNALQEQIRKIKQRDEIIVAGDLNGRTGKRANDNTVGSFGEETVNDNDERLIEMCQLENLKILNGFYKHRDIHKYTWTQETRKLKSIIDYTIMKNRSTIVVKDVRVKRGSECGSDYRQLMSKMNFPWNGKGEVKEEKMTENKQRKPKFKLYILQDETIRNLYQRRLDQKLTEFRYEDKVNDTYEHIKDCLKQAGLEALGKVEIEKTDRLHRWDFTENTITKITEKKKQYNK